MITYSFSIDSIAQIVLARAALRHILHSDRPELLTDDHRPALDILIQRGFNMLSLAMIPAVVRTDSAPTEGLLTFDLDIPEAPGLFPIMEEAIALYVLTCAYQGVDDTFALRLRTDYDSLLRRCRSQACLSSTRPAIRPCWL